ncbi:MAG: autotransporter outer membrane beta-barrel domain-containing protein [Magnetospirillum sp.]|nr:autotransporter outer membrane beta-barrel domain-containing protein [Magnetospirillum sp.]
MSCPGPAPAPNQAPAVTPDTSRQSASATAGLIADRVATVVSSINVGGAGATGTGPGSQTGDRANAHCPSLVGNVPDALDQALGASTSAEANGSDRIRYNSVWTGGSYNHIKKDDVNGRYNGDVKNGVAGYDRRVTKDLILGLATGYEEVDITTEYNQGTVEGSSVSVSPYLGYIINGWLSVDATIGHTWIDYDFSRNSGAVKGSTNAGRWFGSANVNAVHRMGDFKLRGSLGYLRLYERQDAYRDSTGAQVEEAQVNFGQIRTTVGGSYDIATGFGVLSPNAFVRVEYDTPASHSVMVGNNWMSSADRTGAVFGVGVDAAIADDLTLNLTATSTQFRQNTEAYSLIGNIRYSF